MQNKRNMCSVIQTLIAGHRQENIEFPERLHAMNTALQAYFPETLPIRQGDLSETWAGMGHKKDAFENISSIFDQNG
jgi:hypothetical protein